MAHTGAAARVSCACFSRGAAEAPRERAPDPRRTRAADPDDIGASSENPEDAQDVDRRRRRTLVVDDDHDIAELVRLALTDEGYEVVIASNGSAALQETLASPFDLILLDLRMPVMDGWEFAREYQARQEPRAPVIVVTAARDAAERAAEIHADGYISKPFSLEELLAVVKHHLRQG
jgi:two-component system, chemotaxis family, chemotaxis protein CheY